VWVERLGQQREGLDVAWADHGEMSVVEGGDLVDVEPLGQGDGGRIAGAERQVRVLLD
jgi:hypothetical protein